MLRQSKINAEDRFPNISRGVMRAVRVLLVVIFGILGFSAPGSTASKGDAEHGNVLYVEYCGQCHGRRGEGWGWGKKIPPPPVPIPDLSNTELMMRLSDEYLFDIIKGGGEAVGKTRLMPPAERVMSDAEIWDVIAYLRSLTKQAQGPKEKER